MTDHRPEVYVQPDGTILVWLEPDTDDFIELTQRQWAMLQIAVDTELCARQMDQSEVVGSGEMVELDPDWVEHASLLAYERERLAEEQSWWTGLNPERNVVKVWPEGDHIGEPIVLEMYTEDGVDHVRLTEEGVEA